MPKAKPPVTFGYRIWSAMFTLTYPIISVFTFVLTLILSLLSGVSKGLVWLATRIKK